jgi:hypothetical protein
MWDNRIADKYGFAQNSEGYCRFVQTMRNMIIILREFEPNLEVRIENMVRIWAPPIAKVLDEWNVMTTREN